MSSTDLAVSAMNWHQPGLDYRAGISVQSECSWWRIGSIPGAIKAGFRTECLPSRDAGIIRSIGDGHRTPTLRVAAIPQLRNGLPIKERELQTPSIDRR